MARVHLYPPDHCAGAEMMLHELLKALAARGHEVEVHLSRRARLQLPYLRNGVRIVPRGAEDWQEAAAKADVLITHLDNTSTLISTAIAYDKPLVQVLHNTHAPTRMWASCRNDLIVYNSEWMRVELGDDANGIVCHPRVPVADYQVRNPGIGYAITLINTQAAKGGVLFAQLAALLPGHDFIAVGGAYGEQLDPRLPNVEIRPHGTDMRRVYRDTKVLLLPSQYESYGRVGVEAACSGIPTLAVGHPGVVEALGDAGVYMHPDAPLQDWRGRLLKLSRRDDDYAHYSQLAQARALELDLATELETQHFCDRVEALA